MVGLARPVERRLLRRDRELHRRVAEPLYSETIRSGLGRTVPDERAPTSDRSLKLEDVFSDFAGLETKRPCARDAYLIGPLEVDEPSAAKSPRNEEATGPR